MTLPKIKRTHIWIGGLIIIASTAYGASTQLFAPKPQIVQAVNNAISPKALVAANLTCEELLPNVTRAVDDYNKSQKLEWKTGGATYGPGNYINLKKFYKILYSPGLGTCVAVVIDQSLLQEGKKLGTHEESYSFYDAATYEYKDWIDTIKHGSPYYTMTDVAQKITEFQTATSSPIKLGEP